MGFDILVLFTSVHFGLGEFLCIWLRPRDQSGFIFIFSERKKKCRAEKGLQRRLFNVNRLKSVRNATKMNEKQQENITFDNKASISVPNQQH